MLATVIVFCALAAQAPQAAPASPSIAGTWTLSLQADHVIPVGLVLQQDGTRVTGTMMIMQKDVALEGELVNGALKLTSNAAFVAGAHHGEAPAATADGKPAAKMALTGKVNEDGTLAGELTTSRGALPWTAERLRERPAPKKATATASTAASAGIGGAWKMTVHGAMSLDLDIEQDGAKVSGTVTSDHSGPLSFEGTFADGTLTFSTNQGTPPTVMHLDYSATLTDNGTLSGRVSGPMGRMDWTAERVKK